MVNGACFIRLGMDCSMGSLWWGLAWRFAVVFGATLHGWRGHWTNAVQQMAGVMRWSTIVSPPKFPSHFPHLGFGQGQSFMKPPSRAIEAVHWDPKDGSFSLGSALGSLPIGTWRTSPEPLPCRSFLPRRLGRPAERTWKEPRAPDPSDGRWMIWMEFHRSFDPHIFASWQLYLFTKSAHASWWLTGQP